MVAWQQIAHHYRASTLNHTQLLIVWLSENFNFTHHTLAFSAENLEHTRCVLEHTLLPHYRITLHLLLLTFAHSLIIYNKPVYRIRLTL